MANDHINIKCKHCGNSISIGNGFCGSYSPCFDSYELSDFIKSHGSMCDENVGPTNISDNAVEHFVICGDCDE